MGFSCELIVLKEKSIPKNKIIGIKFFICPSITFILKKPWSQYFLIRPYINSKKNFN